jgi:hypothetical protein
MTRQSQNFFSYLFCEIAAAKYASQLRRRTAVPLLVARNDGFFKKESSGVRASFAAMFAIGHFWPQAQD